MSLLNAFCCAGHALIGVDTLASVEGKHLAAALEVTDGARIETSKLIPLVHANAVIAGRGTGGFLSMVFLACHMKPHKDFDALDAGMLQMLRDVHAAVPQLDPAERTRFDEQEILLAGWSKKKGPHGCDDVCANARERRLRGLCGAQLDNPVDR